MDHTRLQSPFESTPPGVTTRRGFGSPPEPLALVDWPAPALAWLERHLALATDSERRRVQKVASVLVGAGGGLMALVLGVIYATSGVEDVAGLYLITTLWTCLSIGAMLLWPRSFYGLVMVTSIYVTLHPWAVTVLTGGYGSGLLPMMWALLGPVAALLLLDERPALLDAGLFVVAAIVAALLDPLAALHPLPLSAHTRAILGFISATVPTLMVIVSSVFLLAQLERAFALADSLLRNMLPSPIAQRLKHSPGIIAEGCDDVTVLFADIVDFTRRSDGVDPCQIVTLLNSLFADFDALCGRHSLEKIKTIGDAYMVVGGLDGGDDHCQRVVAFALDLLESSRNHIAWDGQPIAMRIGVHRGPVVAGVIGDRKYSFDVWGDTVNVASRMEYCGLPDTIQVTAAVRSSLDGRYQWEAREPFYVKGKGLMTTYLLRPDLGMPA